MVESGYSDSVAKNNRNGSGSPTRVPLVRVLNFVVDPIGIVFI